MAPFIRRRRAGSVPLSWLDQVCRSADDPRRPLDFTVILHLRGVMNSSDLETGARSACRRFPVTGSRIRGRNWVPLAESCLSHASRDVGSKEDARFIAEHFVGKPWNLEREAPVRQQVLSCPDEDWTQIITGFHHVAADGISAGLWLGHQLAVALRRSCEQKDQSAYEHVSLRARRPRISKIGLSSKARSQPIWRRAGDRSSLRFWKSITIESAPLRLAALQEGFVCYNDILATCALEMFRRWNIEHDFFSARRRLCLWLPVNIRQSPMSGFGNGSSRIRVYSHWAPAAPMLEKCRGFRRELLSSWRSGEWRPPSIGVFPRIPERLLRWALRGYLRRPWIDAGSAPFSHLEHRGEELNEALSGRIERIEIVGPLHSSHCVGFYGMTCGGRTWLTLTYDPALLSASDIGRLIAIYREELGQVRMKIRGGEAPMDLAARRA